MKGIILAGGSGTRLYPITKSISKQILPVYDKPMIYYPLSVLMLCGIRDILIISTPRDLPLYKELLNDGSQLGIKLEYVEQEKPKGIAEAFILGEQFIGSDTVALILGDNIFYGEKLEEKLNRAVNSLDGATIFGYCVDNPKQFGVVEFDSEHNVVTLEEKPMFPKSNYAIPGLYFYNNQVVNISKQIKPSLRGELEITSINNEYLENTNLKVELLDDEIIWFDSGTCDSLLDASNLIKKIQESLDKYVGCIEEIAYNKGYIDEQDILKFAQSYKNTKYSEYLLKLINNRK